MRSKLEQVAIALYSEDGLKHAAANVSLEQSWDMSPRYHLGYLRRARKVIEIMRQPTDAMIDALLNLAGDELCWDADSSTASAIWETGIEAALNEQVSG